MTCIPFLFLPYYSSSRLYRCSALGNRHCALRLVQWLNHRRPLDNSPLEFQPCEHNTPTSFRVRLLSLNFIRDAIHWIIIIIITSSNRIFCYTFLVFSFQWLFVSLEISLRQNLEGFEFVFASDCNDRCSYTKKKNEYIRACRHI